MHLCFRGERNSAQVRTEHCAENKTSLMGI